MITKRLRDLREDHDLKQANIASLLHIALNTYGAYERGKRMLPIEHLVTLCNFYNVSPEYILGFTNEPKQLPKK